MHAAAFSPRGGVAPRSARPRGQSIIEYVLIVAIIGLVVVFAGPQVSQAIHNQFGSVTNTLASGTHGGGFTGGGGTSSGGAGSKTPNQEQIKYLESMKSVTEKDAKDWTLADQQLAAEDIAKRGTASVAFPKARVAMDAGTEFSVKLTNGQALTYRIVGINHDDLADGSGKAGLTFEATNFARDAQRMNPTDTNVGGWEKSELRSRLNTGDLWSLLPAELRSKVKAVKKLTDNQGGGKAGTPSATADKVFLLSASEVYGDLDSDGTQYEYYKSKGVTMSNYSGASSGADRWTRSVTPSYSTYFRSVFSNGNEYGNYATSTSCVLPAFSF